MKPVLEPRDDLSPMEIDAVEDHLYEHNSVATGRDDGQGLGFVIRDADGKTIAVAAGYTWAGVSEIRQLWVDKAFRGRGYGGSLVEAMVAEARRRGALRVWVASYDFQAPAMYERFGFKRMAEFQGWPEGHVNVILCRDLSAG
jgi:N-acetylglutamate synthase-like GNAT family acetyltransferase